MLLLAYVVFGGLLFPLKSGITGVRLVGSGAFELASGTASKIEIDLYNVGPEPKIEKVILRNDSLTFESSKTVWDSAGTITADFLPYLGNKENRGGMYSLFVLANNRWMAFPSAFGLVKGSGDTALAKGNDVELKNLNANPDLLKGFPNRPILNESIRNLLYHVPMWFSMIFLLAFSAWYAIKYLSTGNIDHDLRSDSLVRVGILAGILGCLTGMVWARVTWGTWWPRDPKLNGVAIGMLMYFAYLLLRGGIRDDHQKARVGAVYNLFVFPVFIALIIVMPKLAGDSLHPGAGGTVTFKQYDLDNTMRMFFYPAVIGWILTYAWIGSLLYRYRKIEFELTEENSK